MLIASFATTVSAQTTTVYGTLGNFDVYNDTGGEACGFEIEFPGVTAPGTYYTYPSARYSSGIAKVTSTGTSVFYLALWDPVTATYQPASSWFAGMPGCTQPATVKSPTLGHQCTGSVGGCEHFGIGSATLGGNANYYWLVPDPATPGQVKRAGTGVPIPSPIWTPVEPAVFGADPVLVAAVDAPIHAEVVGQYGEAQWMKTFKTKSNRAVLLDELLSDNPIVPQDAARVEVAWDVIQDAPPSGGNGGQKRKHKQGQDNVNVDTRAIIRRYEMYKYSGNYDPLTHEALCADLTCTAPSDGELGDYIGAQMAAANIQVQGIKVTTTGPGSVKASSPKIDCGTVCTASAAKGSVVTLTANPGGGQFLGWSGACAGTALTCSVTINDETDIGAKFSAVFTLSVGISNKGTVIADHGGINCGKTCSGKVASGTPTTLTAIPPAGKTFVNWTGGCSGTNPVCTVMMTTNISVNAVFSK
jgi:hypothetical protein